ncbi:LuxR C-terminal-related transcriptional regulator [Flagellimonas algicola]|uniref:HTH luxR-type domain-containing protein n=1 Tax=Flagellimonas algicola TaxID=2583815 RepID=A0ABY2WPD7_9FLAO|nr:LuxR C-terminal-related transcriptional regulator [Allomuricauda algicola]TMU56853.1 hypothetical protein FGG15_04720 [Allomuricauda algicola]
MKKNSENTTSPANPVSGVSPVDLIQFAKTTSNFLANKKTERKAFNDLAHFPLIPGKQAIYVMDWQQNRVTYQRNIEGMLGYPKNEFDDSIIHTHIHPDDINVVSRVIKGVVDHYTHFNATSINTYLTISYRLLKRDGTPIKVLRQSGAYETMGNGKLISNWSLITDIGFISNNNQIEWDVNANEVDRQKFKEKVYLEFQDYFSNKELLVITGIKKGLKSSEIANQLFISKHTVDTHRKNILRKCNCNNKEQLLAFCYRNGIF